MLLKEKSKSIQDIFSLFDFINLKIIIHIKREASAVNDQSEKNTWRGMFYKTSGLISDEYEVKQIIIQAKSIKMEEGEKKKSSKTKMNVLINKFLISLSHYSFNRSDYCMCVSLCYFNSLQMDLVAI